MENIPYPQHKCSDGISPFYKAQNKWKTNLVQEDLQPQRRTTMWKEWGLLWGQIIDYIENDQ